MTSKLLVTMTVVAYIDKYILHDLLHTLKKINE